MENITSEVPSVVTGDLLNTLVMFGLAFVLVLIYSVRMALKGRAHFDRVDRQGGSVLMGKGLMEMGYWFLQPVARLLIIFRMTPNMISFASLIFGALAGVCLGFGHFGFGGVFGIISALLDTLDGLVARLTQRSSDAGEVLDAAVDRYSEFFFLSGLVIYYREMPVLVGFTLLALLGSLMVSYSTAKAEALQVVPPRGNMRRTERAFVLILGALLSPITIPWFETHFYSPVAVGYPMVFALGLVGVLANFSAIERLYAIARAIRLREREALLALTQRQVQDARLNSGLDEGIRPHPEPEHLKL